MLKVGLTGGIGAGKTYVCHVFETFNVPVYYADERAKYLMQHNAMLIESLKQAFGNSIYFDGILDRPKLAALVFNNKEALNKLNSLVHPAVFKDTAEWLVEYEKAPYTIHEAALIFESGSYKQLDKVITVTAPIELRIDRVIKRDRISRENVLARMTNQLDEVEKVKRSDYVINNDLLEPLLPQIELIHHELMAMAKK